MEYTLCCCRTLSESELRILVLDPYKILRKLNAVAFVMNEQSSELEDDLTREPNWVV